jgi:stage V sporulation protein D (sporulation-specific penicillin-binding protein)
MKKNFSNWRIIFIFIFILIFGAAIISRLFFLQILNHKLYQAQALGQQVKFNNISGLRGEVFFENSQESDGSRGSGETKSLIINKDKWILSFMPGVIKDKLVFADSLSKAIEGFEGDAREEILLKLDTEETHVIFKKDLPLKEADKIKALNLAGISWENNPARYYPQENLASSVVGFFGGEGTGQYGIEGYYEDILKGKSGITENKRGIDSIFSNNNQIFLDGSDLYLTLDYNIQFQAETLLKKAKDDLDIEGGQIIVMKPDSGRILALANYPSFNPNQYSKEKDMEVFQNGAVQKLFEPGSIMKPFTMAMGLNEGKVTPDTKYIDAGSLKIGIETIHNFDRKNWGEQTMTGVLENSINTGAVFVEQLVGHETFFDYIDKFGFTKKTEIDLQGEVYSRNENLKSGNDIEYATASFGQGIELTPMQIMKGYCAIANGGRLVKPYLVDKITNGIDQQYTEPQILEQVFSKTTASQLTAMLISVIEKGAVKGAKIPGYYIAGKTGTAQIPLVDKKGYEPNKTIQTFVGFGPALNPQFLILIKLDAPKSPLSSVSTVPIFKTLTQYIINYWQIPQDYDVKK